jgi:hypothetical protein
LNERPGFGRGDGEIHLVRGEEVVHEQPRLAVGVYVEQAFEYGHVSVPGDFERAFSRAVEARFSI